MKELHMKTVFHSFDPKIEACMTAKVVQHENHRIAGRKILCWSCQKEYLRHQGTESFIVKRQGTLNTNNNLKKFICFNCKPKS